MKRVLVSILSDHLIPNYLFIKEMRGQFNELLFIDTPYVEERQIAAHLEQALGKEENSVPRVVVESDCYQEGLQTLEKANLSQDVYYMVNLTGGTKIMSLMVFDFFRKLNSSFFYIVIYGMSRCFPCSIAYHSKNISHSMD